MIHNAPGKGRFARFLDWLTQWADTVEASEASVLEGRITRLEHAIERLQHDRRR